MYLPCIRSFATKRTIPYIQKGNWTFPTIAGTSQSLQQHQTGTGTDSDQWGETSKPVVNVPKGWRRLKSFPEWKKQMFALKEKFPEGWSPLKKLSREKMERMREIKASHPNVNLSDLADMFKISPEAARRIIKSKWKPNKAESDSIAKRWKQRGEMLKAAKPKEAAARGNSRQNLLKRRIIPVDQRTF